MGHALSHCSPFWEGKHYGNPHSINHHDNAKKSVVQFLGEALIKHITVLLKEENYHYLMQSYHSIFLLTLNVIFFFAKILADRLHNWTRRETILLQLYGLSIG